MQTCPLLRASLRDESRETARRVSSTGVNARAHGGLPMAATLLGWLGWRALQDLLNAIPDSNDDFGLF
jgi:hypothetical protein